MLLLIYTASSLALSVFSRILYLTPAFGLFNSLRHLQGEMYPFWDPYYYPEDFNDYLFYFGNAPPIPWGDISRWNYTGMADATPPPLTLYTYFSIEQYLGFFIGIFVLQFLCQLILKIYTNPLVFRKLSWIDSTIHIFYCCFIPCPMEEWDAEKGTVTMHKMRKDLVFKEMLASMCLNFSFNLLLMVPLIILGMYQF